MKILLEAEAKLSRVPQVIGPGALVPAGQVILRTPKGSLLAIGREEFEAACPEAVLDAASGRYSVPEFTYPTPGHSEPEETLQAAPERDVSAFHQGAGWYEIDGQRIRGKKAAQAALNEEAR